MGGEVSKKDDYSSSSSSTRKAYQNTLRAYAKWDYHSVRVNDDASRFTTSEIHNFKRHNQSAGNSPLVNQSLYIKESLFDGERQSHRLPRKKVRFDENLHGKSISFKQNQSNGKNLITAQQLIENQSERRQRYRSQNKSTQRSLSTTNLHQLTPPNMSNKQIPLDLQFVLINQDHLQNVEQIGKGHFGTVYRASYKGNRDVALKILKSDRKDVFNGMKSSKEESDDYINELLHEAHIMIHLEHENLLGILGVTFFGDEKQLSLVTDLMKNGSLLDYLRKHRDIFVKSDPNDVTLKLNSFAQQIFEGMLYLEEKSIIHRDLAARNCLIGEDNILKIADFGLTKLTECGLYKGSSRTIFAIRWSPPEVIFSSRFSSRSDVWSYGITIWEIYSLGEQPYGNLQNTNIKNLLKNPSENFSRYLPQSNQFGSDETYTHLILPCLTYNLTLRPRFRDLKNKIISILK